MKREKQRYILRGNVFFFTFILSFFFFPIQKILGQDSFIKIKVVAEQANIRLEPDISSIIIRQVPQGTILNATGKKEDWFAVQLMPKQGTAVSGFVHESLVIVIEPLPEEKKPPVVPRKKIPVPAPPIIEEEEERPTIPFKFSIAINGGGNYVRGEHLNSGTKGLADLYQDILGTQGEGKINSIHLGYIFGLEISFPLSERLSWGIEAEYIQGKNESQVNYFQGSSSSILHVRPNLRAIPISLFLCFYPVPNLYVKGGISYYFATCSYMYSFQRDDLTQQWDGRARAQNLGLLGGLGYLKNISSQLSLFAEVTGRLAKIQGFKGNEDFQDSSGESFTEHGTLYLIQSQILEERTHSVLFIRETRPNEAGIISADKAQIDFSGISLKIGLRIHF